MLIRFLLHFIKRLFSLSLCCFTDPLYNDIDANTRESIRKNVVNECFFVDTPLQDILRRFGVVEDFLGGSGKVRRFSRDSQLQ